MYILNVIFKRNNSLVPLHRFFNQIADGVLNIFLPVFIYTKTEDIWLAVIFMAMEFGIQMISNLIFKKFLLRHSFIAICIHVLFIIACQSIIVFAGTELWTIIIAGAFLGLSNVFYFAPMYFNFAFSCKNINSAKLITAESIGKSIVILISSYLIHNELSKHFYWALGIAMALYVISIVPLAFYNKKIKRHFDAATKHNIWSYQKSFKRSITLQNLLGFCHAISKYLVPLYLMYMHLNFQAVGYVLAIAELSRVAGAYLSKYLVDYKKFNLATLISSLIWGISCLGLIIVKNDIADFIFAALLLFALSMIFVANFGFFTRRIAYEGGLYAGVIMREYHMNQSKLLALGLFTLFALPVGFTVVFAIGAAESIGLYLTPYRKRYSPPQMPFNILDDNTTSDITQTENIPAVGAQNTIETVTN